MNSDSVGQGQAVSAPLPPGVVVRQCRLDDEPQVVELWKEVFDYPEAHNEPIGRFRRKMTFQPELFLVAESTQRVVATVMGGYDGVRGWLYAVAVAPEFRNQGIAKTMIGQVEGLLVSLGCPKINLFVRPDNLSMATYYEELGYRAEAGIAMSKLPGFPPVGRRRRTRRSGSNKSPPANG